MLNNSDSTPTRKTNVIKTLNVLAWRIRLVLFVVERIHISERRQSHMRCEQSVKKIRLAKKDRKKESRCGPHTSRCGSLLSSVQHCLWRRNYPSKTLFHHRTTILFTESQPDSQVWRICFQRSWEDSRICKRMKKWIASPPNFDRLLLGCIDADRCK